MAGGLRGDRTAHHRRGQDLAQRLTARRGRNCSSGTSRRSTHAGRSCWPSARARPPASTAPTTAARPGRSPSATPTPRAFYDCLTFFDRPPRTRHERPGGRQVPHPLHQRRRPFLGGAAERRACPPALEGEAGFAASGQCLVGSGPRDVWLATGGAARARVLHSADRGLTWTVADTPDPGRRPGPRCLRARLPRPGARHRRRRRLPRRPAVPAGRGHHRRRRPHLEARRAAAARLPLRGRLAPVTAARPPSRSAPPAPTSPPTAAAPGARSTPARTTPSTARRTAAAGRRGRRDGWPGWRTDRQGVVPTGMGTCGMFESRRE